MVWILVERHSEASLMVIPERSPGYAWSGSLTALAITQTRNEKSRDQADHGFRKFLTDYLNAASRSHILAPYHLTVVSTQKPILMLRASTASVFWLASLA